MLTGYRTTPGPLTPAQLRDLHHLGRSYLLLLLLLLHSDHADADETTGLRLYRAEVHQATGFLADALGIPLEEAFLRLRARATAREHPLSDLAHALLTRRLPPRHLQCRVVAAGQRVRDLVLRRVLGPHRSSADRLPTLDAKGPMVDMSERRQHFGVYLAGLRRPGGKRAAAARLSPAGEPIRYSRPACRTVGFTDAGWSSSVA
ncbi:ANTAR domain-containing protein, partial [Streptomyces silvensis]|uniref:ANTAR domain-containing protein n=1 Tax=Streptomyces silvensis TaxID=1765722 RepID=UPI0018E31473